MCENIRLPSGVWCDTVGELRKALYPQRITPYSDVGPLSENECLCCIDFKALAAREGWSLEHDCGSVLATADEARAGTSA